MNEDKEEAIENIFKLIIKLPIDLYISQSLEITYCITEASIVQCTQGCSVDQKVWRAQHMLPLPINSAKTITALDQCFKTIFK